MPNADAGGVAMVDQGLYVFPCRSDKTPAIAGGHKSATNDPRMIEQWRGYPLMAAPTGARNDFDIVDIDRGAEDWLMNYECSRGLPSTRIVGTRSGGLHLYFKHYEGMRCSAGLLAKNVDIRGEGGYAIIKGAGYRVLSEAAIASWPEPMLELLREAEEARRGRYTAPSPSFHVSQVSTGAGADDRFVPLVLHYNIVSRMRGAPPINQRRVRGVLRRLVRATENRNYELYWAGLQFRELIGANIIGRSDVEKLMFMAAQINGYVSKRGEKQTRDTIGSGLDAAWLNTGET
jgi:hypothetical protein